VRRGHALADGAAVVVNLSRLRRIRSVDAANNALCAEAGVPLAVVQAAAQEVDGCFRWPWPARARVKSVA
jgi:FAD/FMN-containing dehydrogenase